MNGERDTLELYEIPRQPKRQVELGKVFRNSQIDLSESSTEPVAWRMLAVDEVAEGFGTRGLQGLRGILDLVGIQMYGSREPIIERDTQPRVQDCRAEDSLEV
jgi:hypothetical protein